MDLYGKTEKEGLEIIWRRHIFEGYGKHDDDVRIDAVADLAVETELALDAHRNELDNGDLVVIIARRPKILAEAI